MVLGTKHTKKNSWTLYPQEDIDTVEVFKLADPTKKQILLITKNPLIWVTCFQYHLQLFGLFILGDLSETKMVGFSR